MTWAPTEAQKRIFTILSTDTALQSLLGGTPTDPRVYDHVPDAKSYPYVTMQIRPLTDRGNHTWDGVEIRFQINVWYRAPGRGDLKVQEIQARIDQLLHNKDICVEGWDIISLRRTLVDILIETDNVTQHGVQIFNLMLGEA